MTCMDEKHILSNNAESFLGFTLLRTVTESPAVGLIYAPAQSIDFENKELSFDATEGTVLTYNVSRNKNVSTYNDL